MASEMSSAPSAESQKEEGDSQEEKVSVEPSTTSTLEVPVVSSTAGEARGRSDSRLTEQIKRYSALMLPDDQVILRVFHADNLFSNKSVDVQSPVCSYKAVLVDPSCSASTVCQVVAEKLQIPKDAAAQFHLYAVFSPSEKKKLEAEDRPFDVLHEWDPAQGQLRFAYLTEALEENLDSLRTKFSGWDGTFAGAYILEEVNEVAEGLTHGRLLEPRFEEIADTFLLAEDGRVHSFKCILSIRCPSILDSKTSGIQSVKKGRCGWMVEFKKGVAECSSLRHILRFIYTGLLHITEHEDPAMVFKVIALSKSLGLERLEWLALTHLQDSLTFTNLFSLLALAIEHKQSKAIALIEQFALQNYTEVRKNSAGLEKVGIDAFQEIVVLQAQATEENAVVPSSVVEQARLPPQPANTIISDFCSLYESMEDSDVLLQTGREVDRVKEAATDKDNKVLNAHRCLLSAHSKPLFDLLSREHKKKPFSFIHPLSEEAIQAMLKFVYYDYTDITPAVACELLTNFVAPYNTHYLMEVCRDILLIHVTAETAPTILLTTYLPHMLQWQHNEELKERCLSTMVENLLSVDLSPLSEGDKQVAIDVGAAMQQYLPVYYEKKVDAPKRDPAVPSYRLKHFGSRLQRQMSFSPSKENSKLSIDVPEVTPDQLHPMRQSQRGNSTTVNSSRVAEQLIMGVHKAKKRNSEGHPTIPREDGDAKESKEDGPSDISNAEGTASIATDGKSHTSAEEGRSNCSKKQGDEIKLTPPNESTKAGKIN